MTTLFDIPKATDAEAAILGGLLIDNTIYAEVDAILEPEDFYFDKHRKVYEDLMSSWRKGATLDVLGIVQLYQDRKDFDSVGGITYVTSLPEQIPTTANIEYYANLVREKSIQRTMQRELARLQARIHDGDTESVLEDMGDIVLELNKKRTNTTAETFTALGDILFEEWEYLSSEQMNNRVICGIKEIDERGNGFERGDVVIIGARPSVGKSALSLQMAIGAAVNGYRSAFVSLEMKKSQIAKRVLASTCDVPIWKLIKKQYLQEEDKAIISDSANALSSLPFSATHHIVHKPSELDAMLSQLKIKQPDLSLVVIDYIQLLGDLSSNNRTNALSAISRTIKLLAVKLDVVMIVLSQLNRKVEERADKAPLLSDLRDTGGLEQDADVAILMERVSEQKENAIKDHIRLHYRKWRQGPIGYSDHMYDKEHQRFESMENTNDRIRHLS